MFDCLLNSLLTPASEITDVGRLRAARAVGVSRGGRQQQKRAGVGTDPADSAPEGD